MVRTRKNRSADTTGNDAMEALNNMDVTESAEEEMSEITANPNSKNLGEYI